jgi:chromosomal replication initiation ATPase DnaA
MIYGLGLNMGLFDKHLAYRDAYKAIQQAGADPFNVRFDAVLADRRRRRTAVARSCWAPTTIWA